MVAEGTPWVPAAVYAPLTYARPKSYLWQLVHHPSQEREPHWLAHRPSVKFCIIFLFKACLLIFQALVMKQRKSLSVERCWVYLCLLCRWSVLLGLHDWVCKVDGPCPWKHDGMLPRHVLVRIWHRKSFLFCLHLVAWLTNHFHVWAPFSPSVKWEEQSRWIINFL